MAVQDLPKQASVSFIKAFGPVFGRFFHRKMVDIISATNDALAPVGVGSEDHLASYTATGIFKDSGLDAADISNAEFQTLNGVSSAIQTQLNGKASSSEGVTGGDSHNHTGGGGAQIDHGGLSGRSDDDHTNYHTDNRGDERYFVGANILVMQEFNR